MACACTLNPQSGNDTYGIPIKIGEPLSDACSRDQVMGSIPEVLKYAGFTLVGGAPASSKISNGGISNIASFFKVREGCYYNRDSILSGSTCS